MFPAPILLVFWIVIILVAGCTSDAHAFLYEQAISFHLNGAPNFRDLLITHDIHLHKEFYIIQKIGHIAAFGLLFIFILATIKTFRLAFILCSLFAFFTEILQLYFQRNGRLFDVGVDIIGILIALFICKSFTPTFLTKEVNEVSGWTWDTIKFRMPKVTNQKILHFAIYF